MNRKETILQLLAAKTIIILLIESKLIICALGNLRYKISREKFEPEPEVRGSNPGYDSNFSLEIL